MFQHHAFESVKWATKQINSVHRKPGFSTMFRFHHVVVLCVADGRRAETSDFCCSIVIGMGDTMDMGDTMETPAALSPQTQWLVGSPLSNFDVALFARSTVTQFGPPSINSTHPSIHPGLQESAASI